MDFALSWLLKDCPSYSFHVRIVRGTVVRTFRTVSSVPKRLGFGFSVKVRIIYSMYLFIHIGRSKVQLELDIAHLFSHFVSIHLKIFRHHVRYVLLVRFLYCNFLIFHHRSGSCHLVRRRRYGEHQNRTLCHMRVKSEGKKMKDMACIRMSCRMRMEHGLKQNEGVME